VGKISSSQNSSGPDKATNERKEAEGSRSVDVDRFSIRVTAKILLQLRCGSTWAYGMYKEV
jgi:hypothetical protein